MALHWAFKPVDVTLPRESGPQTRATSPGPLLAATAFVPPFRVAPLALAHRILHQGLTENRESGSTGILHIGRTLEQAAADLLQHEPGLQMVVDWEPHTGFVPLIPLTEEQIQWNESSLRIHGPDHTYFEVALTKSTLIPISTALGRLAIGVHGLALAEVLQKSPEAKRVVLALISKHWLEEDTTAVELPDDTVWVLGNGAWLLRSGGKKILINPDFSPGHAGPSPSEIGLVDAVVFSQLDPSPATLLLLDKRVPIRFPPSVHAHLPCRSAAWLASFGFSDVANFAVGHLGSVALNYGKAELEDTCGECSLGIEVGGLRLLFTSTDRNSLPDEFVPDHTFEWEKPATAAFRGWASILSAPGHWQSPSGAFSPSGASLGYTHRVDADIKRIHVGDRIALFPI